MDLFDLMSQGREDKALDRLEGILAQFDSEDEAEQDEALDRARSFCDLEWGSYPAGLEALVRRLSKTGYDAGRLRALEEEGAKPGAIIRAARLARQHQSAELDERARIIAQYGSEEAVLNPTEFDRLFMDAATQAAPGEEEAAVAAAHPLPVTVEAARAEALRWEARLHHMRLVDGPESEISLPDACALRHRLVAAAWGKGARVTTLADFSARLDYWASRAAEDVGGYAVLAADFAALGSALSGRLPGTSTKDKARALRDAHPEWSLARIGKELGISRQAVHKHLKAK